ncbi:hypothetical protein AKJ09_00743 [Labilithrix luteola]|uniref:Uncharacterized protein n=1 Tax=Labilithrix luteola TaxID=1391654 RepID=A0A0K1PLU1_9BACT|nr:hypothetical protein [Labilithrix luteola]AKU94079.1 hypothetical protein AKJ09_00743 [Labilithrix luteola]
MKDRQVSARLRLRRRRELGAALVEAVVVIPTFVVLLGGMLFLHSVVVHKQQTMRESRRMAWTSAMAGCGGGSMGGPTLNNNMSGAPGSDASLSDQMGRAESEVSGFAAVSVLGGPAAGGGVGFYQRVDAKTTVLCNNVTRAGDVGGVFDFLFGAGGGIGTLIDDFK